MQIKSQHKDDIKLHKVRLDVKFEKTCVNNQKIISRKKSNKEKIIDVIEKHKEKIRKQHSKSKSEYRLFKFFHYAEFKTVIIKKGLKKIKNN